MSEELAPPVVAVVVSHDPGPWLEPCLESLRDQDYPNLSVLVVDAASEPPLAARVAQVAPTFYIRRLEENRGFGPSANSVRGVIEGATHLLFCHDDVVLSADAVRRMVEEAFRQNAGIVGPKLVDPDEPDRILQLGLGVDRFGAPVRRVERREFDQAQHDEVQETFAVPGGCTLVRADLFEAIDGFDEEISMFGEDVDLCWRARLAGARAFVVPQAVVAHLEATSARRRELREARALQWRHELRVVMKNYGRLRRPIVLSELAIWSIAEICYFLLLGRPDRARQVRDAWRWNLQSARHLAEARARVTATRRISDFELRELFTRRTFRVWRFVQPRIEEALIDWSTSSRSSARRELERFRHADRRSKAVSTLAILLVLIVVFGVRSLIFGHLPLLGGFLPLPSPPRLIGEVLGGAPSLGLGSVAPTSPALLVLGLAGFIAFGAMGVVLKVVIFGSIFAGALGTARLLRPFGGPGPRLAAASAYLLLPLCWNDLATGDVVALIAYAGAPFILRRLLQATGTQPFVGREPPSTRRQLLREVVTFAGLLAFVGCFAPAAAIGAPVLAGAIAIGCVALGSWRSGIRCVLVTLAALAGAFLFTFPWSLSFVTRGVSLSAILGAPTDPTRAPQLGAIVRLELGPFGAGALGLALFVGALFVLIAARNDRYRIAAVVWAQLLASVVIVWAATEGWIGSGGGALRVLAAPVAAAIAAEIGLGVAVVTEEVVHTKFGWKHLTASAFVLVAVAGALPVLGATARGRFEVPATGDEAVLAWIGQAPRGALQRVLFLGDPAALPGTPTSLGGSVASLVSEPGLPEFTALFPGGNVAAMHAVVTATANAESGTTVRLGALLAKLGIRYLIVPTASAPALTGSASAVSAPPPQLLLDSLTAQSDLHELPNEAGILIFENTDWHGRGVPNAGGLPAVLRVLGVAAWLAGLTALAVYCMAERRRRQRLRRERHWMQHPADHGGVKAEDHEVEAALVGGGS